MRVWPLALVVLLIAVSPATSRAAREPEGPTLFGHRIHVPPPLTDEKVERVRASFLQHLADNDLVSTGDRIMPSSLIGGGHPQHGVRVDEPHYATIFLNFFGGMLTSGTNAAEMQSNCAGAAGIDYPGYSGSESDALAIIQVFENAMEPYAVRVAYDDYPPQHLPYSMVMMGGTPQDAGQKSGTLGVSCSTDCGDVWWRDTTLAFTEQSGNPVTLGNTALQEAAHAFGLDHIDGEEHIMYPFSTFGTKVWSSECTPYNAATGPIGCGFIHEVFCPAGDAQNDDAELLAYFGPNAPDVQAPEVVIVEPAPDTMLPSGGSTSIVTEVTDDHRGHGWRLRVVPPAGDEVVLNAYAFETAWDLNFAGQPDGAYEIWVEAIDHDGNAGSAMVMLYVGVDGPMPGEDESGGGGTGSATGAGDTSVGTGDTTPGTDDGDGTGDTAPLGDDGGDEGCQCSADRGPTPAGWAWLPWLALAVRRRATGSLGTGADGDRDRQPS